MQDRYTGDIGDFGKYGLLKALCGDDLSLGVVWYLFPDEQGSGDGSHIKYLDPTSDNLRKFRDCDPALYDMLGEIVRDEARSVRSIRERGVLPPTTVFYEEILSFAGITRERARREHRGAWMRGAREATRGCDVVFADPDNGLESATTKTNAKGPKYAYFDELAPYLDRGQSLVVYHHHNWSAPAREQVWERLSQLGERLGEPFGLRYLRGAPRSFFVVPSETHKGLLFERAKRLTCGAWSEHFKLFAPGGV